MRKISEAFSSCLCRLRVAHRPSRGAEGERMNPKRRFFQIHLSTAVVLMLVAGVLLWANCSKSRGITLEEDWSESEIAEYRALRNQGYSVHWYKPKVVIHAFYGWPATAFERRETDPVVC